MGNENSSATIRQFAVIQKQVLDVQQSLSSLQQTFSTSLQGFALKAELDSKMNNIEEKGSNFTQDLQSLLDASKENQQHIEDLKDKYTKLREDREKPNPLSEVMEKFELRLAKYEEELNQLGVRSNELENSINSQNEFTKTLGIMKTENMIKKEPKNTRKNKKSVKRSPVSGEEIAPKLTRGRAAMLRNQRKENSEEEDGENELNEIDQNHQFVNAL